MADTYDKKIYAHFRADHLHALRIILDNACEDQFTRDRVGLFIEPSPAGGVLLIATDGRALAVIHDHGGHANRALRASLPTRLRARCAPPPPLHVFEEGPDVIELPEWAQPGDVVLTEACALVFPKMSHPSVEDPSEAPALAHVMIARGNHWRAEDYRFSTEPSVDWRCVFAEPNVGVESGRGSFLSPSLYYAFEPLAELAAQRHSGLTQSVSIEFRAGEMTPAIVRIDELPSFIGAIMPMRGFTLAPLPDFIRRPAPDSEADR